MTMKVVDNKVHIMAWQLNALTVAMPRIPAWSIYLLESCAALSPQRFRLRISSLLSVKVTFINFACKYRKSALPPRIKRLRGNGRLAACVHCNVHKKSLPSDLICTQGSQ